MFGRPSALTHALAHAAMFGRPSAEMFARPSAKQAQDTAKTSPTALKLKDCVRRDIAKLRTVARRNIAELRAMALKLKDCIRLAA